MKIKLSQLRKIIREEVKKASLLESLDDVNTSDIAAVTMDTGKSKTAVVYNVESMITALGRRMLDDTFKVVGIVQISEPKGAPCRGAWMIRGITGPGKIMYGLAYAMSPTGLIVPDRSSVSPSARSAWKGYSTKAGRGDVLPLDDADHPAKGVDPYHDAHHTSDPMDDCYTSHGEEYLNSAYRGPGGESALLDRLMYNHERAMKLVGASTEKRDEIESALIGAGYVAFDVAMGF